MINTEENVRNHQMCMAEDEIQVEGTVKRRRRNSLGSEEQKRRQHLQVDQGATISTIGTKRSSRFRGVSRHIWTGRYEAHLWDKLSWNVTRNKKGKKVYIGAYDDEESAARAYDLVALKYWGTCTLTNFPVSDYEREIEMMQNLTKEEYLTTLRRKSSGISRGVSKYRGVARHKQNGRWEARLGRVCGDKYHYLGTYNNQEEAARAYDSEAIERRGIKALTNFDLSSYIRRLKPGAEATFPHQEDIASQTNIFTSKFTLREEPKYSVPYTKKSYSVKKEESQGNICIGSFRRSSSSPALSTLLRSSIFKELVERNLSGNDDEIDVDEDTKNLFSVGSDNEDGDIFYAGVDSNPFVFSSDGDVGQFEENCSSSLYNRSGLSLWKIVTSLSLIS